MGHNPDADAYNSVHNRSLDDFELQQHLHALRRHSASRTGYQQGYCQALFHILLNLADLHSPRQPPHR